MAKLNTLEVLQEVEEEQVMLQKIIKEPVPVKHTRQQTYKPNNDGSMKVPYSKLSALPFLDIKCPHCGKEYQYRKWNKIDGGYACPNPKCQKVVR